MAVTAPLGPPSTSPSFVDLTADTTALIVCGTTCPTPDDTVVDIVKNQYIAPTHPGDIDYVKVTTPQEFWPITGLFRLIGLALGDERLFSPGGPAWPDEPWWKLSGLFDLTANQSLQKGADSLEAAIAVNDNDHRVVYGVSQGAGVANVVKRRLAELYPAGTDDVPDIDFVLSGDPNLPNGGFVSRFPGLYIPILDLLFNGPAATDTPFDTTEIARQYDGFTDFPLYPLNLLADLNAILGILYVHTHIFDVSLPAHEPMKSPAFRGTYGDTSYYVFENPDLPLFGPLRTLGVPEPVIDVVEPFFRVLVELGYDRTIPPWEPTPARLIPKLDPVKLIVDLINAVGEGINNAAALVGLPPLVKTSPPITSTHHDDVHIDAAETEAAQTDEPPHAVSDPALAASAHSRGEHMYTVAADTSRSVNPTQDDEGTFALQDGQEPTDEQPSEIQPVVTVGSDAGSMSIGKIEPHEVAATDELSSTTEATADDATAVDHVSAEDSANVTTESPSREASTGESERTRTSFASDSPSSDTSSRGVDRGLRTPSDCAQSGAPDRSGDTTQPTSRPGSSDRGTE
ncbi:PE-PPE domain-containing protein [Mycobacterium sp. NAZ190054]|uniref:PE-PPE domain-containing protein n=1 Tax=Mycobacterium sp. NAZ190054 TaxID=1747766 RepID=UPI001E3918C8|nr:PE-PPE domain-containing protein [Mycobacterium sp. NAZ190054]